MDPDYQIDRLLDTYGLRKILELIHSNLCETAKIPGNEKFARAANHIDKALGQIRCIDGV